MNHAPHHLRVTANLIIAVLCSALILQAGCGTISRTVRITTSPANAMVQIDQGVTEAAPLETKLTWKAKQIPADTRTLLAQAPDYDPVTRNLTYEQALAWTNRVPWVIHIPLPPLTASVNVQINTSPKEAMVKTDSGKELHAPVSLPAVFRRGSANAAWSTPSVTISAKDHASRKVDLFYEQLVKNPVVQINLDRVREEIPIDITATVDGAIVEINGTVVGKTPLRHTLTFTRSGGDAEWSTFLVVVTKEGYRKKLASAEDQPGEAPPYTHTLTIDTARAGKLNADLEVVKYLWTPIRRLVPGPEGLQIIEEKVLSQVGEIEREPKVGGATRITDVNPARAIMESRIFCMQKDGTIIYSIPFQTSDQESSVFMNMWMQKGNELTRLTDAPQLDIEAAGSPDNQWVYFSSDRLMPGKKYTIWRVSTMGRGGLTKITDSPSSAVDTEPAVSPDATKIAFTSFMKNVRLPHIWTANADGTLPTQIRVGQHPCWSPDGKQLLYVAPDITGREKVWVMDADGGNPTQLTSGDQNDLYPVWMPDGQRIVYASNQAINEVGQNNWDIWIMNRDGTGRTQLTVNGSKDTRPTVSPDGKYIYFFSNRGAKKQNEPCLQIWRIQAPEGK